MIVPRLSALLLTLLAAPALAQTSPPSPAAATSATRPTASAAKAKAKTPVVQPPADAHAQRPAPSAASAITGTGARPAAAAQPQPPAAGAAPEAKGTVTGLPLPRWAALRSDEVNLRVGPGMRFPIEWQYHRRELPVEILREVEVWRLVQDQDGIKGWVHQATLVGHRSFVVKGAEAVLRRAPRDDAEPVARLKPGVIGRIRACAAGADWCEVQVEDYRGWLRRAQFFGSFPGEAVTP